MTEILNRSAVKSYADQMLQLFTAVCLSSVQTGHPLLAPSLRAFPPPSPSSSHTHTHSPRAASSLVKVGVYANDVTLHTWEAEGQACGDGWEQG